MRTAFLFSRLCFRNGFQRVRLSVFRQARRPFSDAGTARKPWFRRPPITGPILLSALSPAAFIEIGEGYYHDGKTGEDHMLEASRNELRQSIPEGVQGIRRVWRGVIFLLDQYIYEPIATGFRLLHLVLIFVPVIFTIPVIWIGGRRKDRDGERSGALWWYGFLVHSMERAGPAFIKVLIGG